MVGESIRSLFSIEESSKDGAISRSKFILFTGQLDCARWGDLSGAVQNAPRNDVFWSDTFEERSDSEG
jgi:hypothetical protein